MLDCQQTQDFYQSLIDASFETVHPDDVDDDKCVFSIADIALHMEKNPPWEEPIRFSKSQHKHLEDALINLGFHQEDFDGEYTEGTAWWIKTKPQAPPKIKSKSAETQDWIRSHFTPCEYYEIDEHQIQILTVSQIAKMIDPLAGKISDNERLDIVQTLRENRFVEVTLQTYDRPVRAYENAFLVKIIGHQTINLTQKEYGQLNALLMYWGVFSSSPNEKEVVINLHKSIFRDQNQNQL